MKRTGADLAAAANDRGALLSERPMGAIHYRIIALCFAAWIFDFYDLILYSFMIVPIARDLHLSQTESSLTLGLALAMTAFGGVIFGFVGDRFGRRPTIIVAVLVYGIGTTMCAASHSLVELLLFRSFTGLGIGGEWAAGQSLVAETVPPARRARYAAYVQVGAPLGAMLAAAAGGHIEPLIGWRNVFLISSAPSFIVAAIVWRWLPESDVWLRADRRQWFNADSLSTLRPYRRIIGLLFVVLLVNSAAYWFTYTWMPSYLRLARGLTPQASGNLMIWMQTGALAGYAAFGVLADRFRATSGFLDLCLDDGAGLAAGDNLLGVGVGDAGPDSRGLDRSGLRHRYLVRRRPDDIRDAADQRAQHGIRTTTERHPRDSVFHPVDNHGAEPAIGFWADARDWRAVLVCGSDHGLGVAGDARAADYRSRFGLAAHAFIGQAFGALAARRESDAIWLAFAEDRNSGVSWRASAGGRERGAPQRASSEDRENDAIWRESLRCRRRRGRRGRRSG